VSRRSRVLIWTSIDEALSHKKHGERSGHGESAPIKTAPAEGLEPPTTGLRTPRLYPLSYAGTACGKRDGAPIVPEILPSGGARACCATGGDRKTIRWDWPGCRGCECERCGRDVVRRRIVWLVPVGRIRCLPESNMARALAPLPGPYYNSGERETSRRFPCQDDPSSH
jgi:hypothetical protein